ncbi:hypothetical protein GCM10007320_29300 [Pseudorhodoferax aquiterrae]|uniref:Uncharacterized protein n=1 Tax=Pseudorhodoferax aquiterrae TaxID=747304 RepID=A0ABQ3G289_9BURK|nr:hypothetical protein GCM10007320_29300 [Pseudorhodoferax aquiterrae]
MPASASIQASAPVRASQQGLSPSRSRLSPIRMVCISRMAASVAGFPCAAGVLAQSCFAAAVAMAAPPVGAGPRDVHDLESSFSLFAVRAPVPRLSCLGTAQRGRRPPTDNETRQETP